MQFNSSLPPDIQRLAFPKAMNAIWCPLLETCTIVCVKKKKKTTEGEGKIERKVKRGGWKREPRLPIREVRDASLWRRSTWRGKSRRQIARMDAHLKVEDGGSHLFADDRHRRTFDLPALF